MTPHHNEWRLATRCIGRRVLVFAEVDSTNTRAAQFADNPHHDGLTFLTDVQTGGRGQYGRSWQCPPPSRDGLPDSLGRPCGVLMSVLLFPPPQLRRPPLLAAWAAVSICETLPSVCGLQGKIKWPNDVLVLGRKVCGILIECGTQPAGAFSVVAGIGLNLNQTAEDFAAAGLPQAGSLRLFTGQEHDRDEVARRLLQVLDEEYERLLQGDLMTLEALWKWRVGLLGRNVRAECLDSGHEGRLLEMGFNGLQLQVPGQPEPLNLPPESVRNLTELS